MKVVVALILFITAVQATDLGTTCANTAACTTGGDSNSACLEDTCYCAADYYDNNGATAAGACTAALDLGDDCATGITDTAVRDKACSKKNEYATCVTSGSSSTCTCSVTGTYDSNGATAAGTCNVAVGSDCTSNADCTARLSNTKCEEFVCVCTSGSGLDCSTSSPASKAVVSFWTLATLSLLAVLLLV